MTRKTKKLLAKEVVDEIEHPALLLEVIALLKILLVTHDTIYSRYHFIIFSIAFAFQELFV
jgi:hypothetical protein